MRIDARGVAIEVDDRGPRAGPALLMIMGLGMQLTGWPDEFADLLAARGFRVVRFDNRDAGLSQGFDERGTPNLALAGIRYALHLNVPTAYTLADMAGDALGVLDALGIAQAHVCGASMGGMIAQHLATLHPDRVRSLTLMMTTSGARHLPQPSARVRRVLLGCPDGRDRDAVVRHLQRVFAVIGSPAYRPDAALLASRLRATVERAWRPAGIARQICAVMADGDRRALIRRIVAPSAIIHGADDPLVRIEAGRELASLIPGATLDEIPGMGHDLPAALWERFADTITRASARHV